MSTKYKNIMVDALFTIQPSLYDACINENPSRITIKYHFTSTFIMFLSYWKTGYDVELICPF